MLNVSATQELATQVEMLQAENALLKTENASLKAEDAELNMRMTKIESVLQDLEMMNAEWTDARK